MISKKRWLIFPVPGAFLLDTGQNFRTASQSLSSVELCCYKNFSVRDDLDRMAEVTKAMRLEPTVSESECSPALQYPGSDKADTGSGRKGGKKSYDLGKTRGITPPSLCPLEWAK